MLHFLSTTNRMKTMNHVSLLAICLIACPILVGCGGSQPTSDLDALADQMDAQASSGDDLDALADQQDVKTAADRAQASLDELKQKAESTRTEADRLANEVSSEITVDDMQRGKIITSRDPISTPIKAGIRAKQKLNMYAWQQGLQIYAATHDFDYPKSHEEFMTDVIEENGYTLDELSEPYEYWYNVELNTLHKRIKPSVIEAAEQEAQTAEAAYATALENK